MTMTDPVYRDDAYARSCTADVVSANSDGICLSRTVFYPLGGGQPGDIGRLEWRGGGVEIVDTRKADNADEVLHIPAPGASLPPAGAEVTATIDWPRRHRLMRMHTALHILCGLIEGEVTGGQIGEWKSRLDFNLPDARLDKDALQTEITRLIADDRPVRVGWISEAELEENPGLVRTMSVKPPRGGGRVRTVEIEGVDYQPCGGTHVRATAEIGAVRVGKIESKGRQNRRVNIHLDVGDNDIQQANGAPR